jgi:superfamily II DNA/RNA helicase
MEHGIHKNMVYFHGDLSQAQRIRIMNKIRLKMVKIILATDVLSRGIDLESVDLVINFSDPYNPENYYHRIGRTARYGKYGVSFLLMNEKKKKIWLREEGKKQARENGKAGAGNGG